MGASFLYKLIFVIPSILVAFVVHEMAHGYSAYLFGDPTAKLQGRLKPDPRLHIDPIGAGILLITVLFTGMGFGWAKPVEVNHYNLRNPRTDMAWIAFAGPLSNFTMAALVGLPMKFGLVGYSGILYTFCLTFVMVNIGLGLFNLIPIPPLDGSKVLYGILPSELSYKLMNMEQRYAQFIPIILILVIISPISEIFLTVPYKLLLNIFTGIRF